MSEASHDSGVSECIWVLDMAERLDFYEIFMLHFSSARQILFLTVSLRKKIAHSLHNNGGVIYCHNIHTHLLLPLSGSGTAR